MSIRVAIPFGGELTMGAGITRFGWPWLGANTSAPGLDPTERFVVIPRACQVISLYVVSRTIGSIVGTNTVTGTYTCRKNGADTGLVLTIVKDADGVAWTGTQSTSVAFVAGDRLSMKVSYDVAFDGTPLDLNHHFIAVF